MYATELIDIPDKDAGIIIGKQGLALNRNVKCFFDNIIICLFDFLYESQTMKKALGKMANELN